MLLPVGLLLSLFLTGCEVFKGAHQSTFDAKGPVAVEQLNLFMLSLWVIGFIFVAVASVLLYAVIRFRWRPGMREEDIPVQTHGNPLLEISLIVVSVLLLVILAIPTVRVAAFSYDVPAYAQDDVLEITATGYQWWWQFEYSDLGVVTSNEMVIPTDRYVRIHVRSADVIHSFWVPKLGGKRDMIPNRSNFLWLKADEEGEYYGQCAEFCGTSHANMLFRVHAYNDARFDEWVAKKLRNSTEPTTELALQGRNLFQSKGCVQCHRIDGAGGLLGPDLSHFGTRGTVAAALLPNDAAGENLALWIRDPERVKPGNLMTAGVKDQNLQEEEIQRLVAYLQSLK
jgi:cytochrome c oxidase subunit II